MIKKRKFNVFHLLILPLFFLGSYSEARAEYWSLQYSELTCTGFVGQEKCAVGTYKTPYVTNYNTGWTIGSVFTTSSRGAVSKEDFGKAKEAQKTYTQITLEENAHSGYVCFLINSNSVLSALMTGSVNNPTGRDCSKLVYDQILTALADPKNRDGGISTDPGYIAAAGTDTSYTTVLRGGQSVTYNLLCNKQVTEAGVTKTSAVSCTKAEFDKLPENQRSITSSTVTTNPDGTVFSPSTPVAKPSSECGVFGFLSVACALEIAGSLIKWLLEWTIIPLGNAAVGFSGYLFDYALYFSIIKFPELVRAVGADGGETGSSIYATWVIIRNLFNIIIVFQLLKIAIYKILGPVINKSSGELKKILMSIIIFTLFVNFSFFFTKALIDISNITALQFYSAMGSTKSDTNKLNEDGGFEQGGISMAIASGMGMRDVSKFYTSGGPSEDAAEAGGVFTDEGKTASVAQSSILGIILIFILLIVISVVLIQGASIFIGRSVTLIFLLVFSPLMFAGGIIGFINKWSEKWWEMLLEQLYVAPLFLGMLFLALKMAGGGQKGGLVESIQDPSLGTNGSYFGALVAMVVQAAIMGGLFMACSVLAKKFGGAAAQKSSALGARAFGAVVGGGAGMIGRRLGGSLGSRLQNSTRIKKWAESTGMTKTFGMGLLNMADKAKTSSFDMRNSGALRSLNAATGDRLGLKGLGTGAGAGGFAAGRAAADKKREDKLKREQELLRTDTYGMSPEEKKKAEKEDKERQERARAGQAITSLTTDAEFEKLKRNEEGLDGDELAYAKEYNKSLDEARKKAKSNLGQVQSAGSAAISRITGRATGSDIAARGTALGRTDDENKKLKEAEINKKKTSAAKKRSDAVKKIFEEFSEGESGEWRTEEQIKEKVAIQIEIEESKMFRYQQVIGADGTGGTEEEREELKKLIARTQALKDSRTRTKSWIKNRENSAWRETPATPNPPTPPIS